MSDETIPHGQLVDTLLRDVDPRYWFVAPNGDVLKKPAPEEILSIESKIQPPYVGLNIQQHSVVLRTTKVVHTWKVKDQDAMHRAKAMLAEQLCTPDDDKQPPQG